jgi:hypothetical protein
MASVILNRKLKKFSEKLFTKYKRSNKLPATVIGAEHKEIKKVDHSGKVPNPICSKLTKELIKIAPLGKKELTIMLVVVVKLELQTKLFY